ncbi:LppU/SCO3897 family protein [Streptomyces monomycini]|uniref:LppU/SCO3897 family protein n=1 Tax=Streptomyces monomycini TaxID=371720 RepID=UPI0004AB0C7E|nr:hypothetical protein [Streptomyces monomycini]
MSGIPSSRVPADPVTDARHKRGRLLFVGMFVVLAGLLALAWFLRGDKTGDAADLRQGDCFKNTGTTETPRPEKVSCTEAGADYTVVKVVKGGVSATLECSGVPGAIGAFSQVGSDAFVVCFGDSS